MSTATNVEPLSHGLRVVAESYVNTRKDLKKATHVAVLLAVITGGVCAGLLGVLPGAVAFGSGLVFAYARRWWKLKRLLVVERVIADAMVREMMEQGLDWFMAAQVLANWLHDARQGKTPFQ